MSEDMPLFLIEPDPIRRLVFSIALYTHTTPCPIGTGTGTATCHLCRLSVAWSCPKKPFEMLARWVACIPARGQWIRSCRSNHTCRELQQRILPVNGRGSVDKGKQVSPKHTNLSFLACQVDCSTAAQDDTVAILHGGSLW